MSGAGMRRRGCGAAVALLLAAGAAAAQDDFVLDVTERLDFDRPEAWAMKFFASASLHSGFGAVEEREPGSLEVAVELMQVPHLDREQRTVGFGGLKEEDLNRSPVAARGRLTVGLPRHFALTVGWSPPVRIDGVEANLISLAVERLLLESLNWSLGARLFGQLGEAGGDLTCSEEDASFEPGSPQNAFGCEAASDDEVQLDYYGVELTASRRLSALGGSRLHFAATVQRMELEFQVDARTFGFLDRTLLVARGETYSLAGGLTWEPAERLRAAVEVFYSPLSVERTGDDGASDDGIVNLRAMLRYRLR